MFIEFLGNINLYLALVIKVVSALLVGLTIGIDRERKNKPAGIKTNMMVCLGSMMYTSIPFLVISEVTTTADPLRVAAQIVTGVGFLGAGAIMRDKAEITGLTTASFIWLTAAFGLLIGLGYVITSLVILILWFATMYLISPIYGHIHEVPKTKPRKKRRS